MMQKKFAFFLAMLAVFFICNSRASWAQINGDMTIEEKRQKVKEAKSLVERIRAAQGLKPEDQVKFIQREMMAPMRPPIVSSGQASVPLPVAPPTPQMPVAQSTSAPATTKPQVVAPADRPKPAEQAKIQTLAKPQQQLPAVSPQRDSAKTAATAPPNLKISAMKIPTDRCDITIGNRTFKKGETVYAVIREDRAGNLYDKSGKSTNVPDFESSCPSGVDPTLFKLPNI